MRLPDGYNIHHPYYPRRKYNTSGPTKVLRDMVTVPLPVVDHNNLHANVEPLPRMTSTLARFSLDVIADSRIGMAADIPNITLFERLTDSYRVLSRCVGRLAVEAGEFYEQFEDQHRYMERAYYL